MVDVVGYKVGGDEDLYLLKTLSKEKVVNDKKVGYGVKTEKDESLGLDDCFI